MKGKSFIVRIDGTIEHVEPENGTNFTLDELKKAIGGGYIEVVPLTFDKVMVVDEDGKRKQLALNVAATRIYNGPNDFIVGDALVCHRKQIR